MFRQTMFSALILSVAVTNGVPMTAAVAQGDKPAKQQKDNKLDELLKERLETLKEILKQTTHDYHTGKASFERVHHATRALLNAKLEMCTSGKERIAVLEEILTLAKQHEQSAQTRFKAGQAPATDALLARVVRLEAEIAIEREKSKMSSPPK